MHYCGTELVWYNEYFISTVANDGQGSSSHSADYASMHFQSFMG